MKIVKKDNGKIKICFEDVSCGEVFEYDDIYWMKIFNESTNKYYAVCIEDGEICDEFESGDICQMVEAKLHIID